ISGWIRSARNGGAWNGIGLTSSAAAADPKRITVLAIAINNNGSGRTIRNTLNGEAVDQNSILVMLTSNGDLDFNGKVDGADYFLIDNGYLNQLPGYRNGDLDYNGHIDAADYFLIDDALLAQGSPLSAAAYPSAPSQPSLGLREHTKASRRVR